ncbi:hypothetical protein BC567DRAFT_236723 [Phyllosticta citribraziliensis]
MFACTPADMKGLIRDRRAASGWHAAQRESTRVPDLRHASVRPALLALYRSGNPRCLGRAVLTVLDNGYVRMYVYADVDVYHPTIPSPFFLSRRILCPLSFSSFSFLLLASPSLPLHSLSFPCLVSSFTPLSSLPPLDCTGCLPCYALRRNTQPTNPYTFAVFPFRWLASASPLYF